jgi:RNA polymerase sigma-70 factor (ECF subfamily)
MYRSERRWLTQWLHRRLPSRHEAEDLTQDTFMRVVSARSPLDLGRPRALLSTIAKGLLIDHYRRASLEQAYLAELALQPEMVAASTEEIALTLEALREVDQLLDGLSAKARAAFLFSRVEDLTHAEIAKELGVSVSRVRQYLAQALRHLYLSSLADAL